MPYKRNYRRRYKKKASVSLQELKRDVNKLKGQLNVEYKHHEQKGLNVDLYDTAGIHPINTIAQGDSDITREGNAVRIKSLELHFKLEGGSTGATRHANRVMLVLDTKPDGSTISLGEILDIGSIDPIVAPRNLNYRTRFVILKDWLCPINYYGTSVYQVDYYKKFNFKTYFDGSSGGLADVQSNVLYFIHFGDAVLSNANKITWSTRIRYIDN